MLLAGMASVALAAAAPAHTAKFDASLTVTQDVMWTQEVSTRSCDGGIFEIHGHGAGRLRVRSKGHLVVIAKRVPGPREAVLLFGGNVPTVPVTGTLTRTGERTFGPSRGGNGKPCGDPLPPVGPDCGTRSLPSDAVMGVAYILPRTWDYPEPVVKAIQVTGPTSPSWQGEGERFRNCPGIDGDGDLFALVTNPAIPPSGPGALPLKLLFGPRRRITVAATARRSTDLAKATKVYVSGSFRVTVVNRYTLTLKRRRA